MSFVPSSFRNGKGISISRFSVSCSRVMGHDITRSYACVPPCVGIHNDVLMTATVPDRAAPCVAVDRHFDGHFGFAPDISGVERQREICASVSP